MANQETKTNKDSQEKIKTEKVKILATLRGSYGAFNKNDIVEVDSKLADSFIKLKLAEKA